MDSADEPHTAPVANPPRSKAIEDAIAFGIDVSLLEENLRKTPDERLRELVRMQELFELLRPHDQRTCYHPEARSIMKAIRISATVGRDRTLVLQLPTETPEGMAEVIVLVPDPRPESTDLDGLLRSVDEWRSRHPDRRTKESIDRELAGDVPES